MRRQSDDLRNRIVGRGDGASGKRVNAQTTFPGKRSITSAAASVSALSPSYHRTC